MISEVSPITEDDYFYSRKPGAAYMQSTLGLFSEGLNIESINDIISHGIYITTVVKTPKSEYTIPTATIKEQLPILEAELEMFPNLKAIMLIVM